MSRRFRICMAREDRESLRPSYSRPKLTFISRKKITFGGVSKSNTAKIFKIQPCHCISSILIYMQYCWFNSKTEFWKLSLYYFLDHRPYFAGSLRSSAISQLQAGKTRSKRPHIQLSPKSCGLNLDARDPSNSYFEPLYPKEVKNNPGVDPVSTVCPPDPPEMRWCRFSSPRNGCCWVFFFISK